MKIVQEIEFWPKCQMINAQIRDCSKNETHKIFWYFEIQMDHLIPTRRPDQLTEKKWGLTV